jgi:acyl carrier protein
MYLHILRRQLGKIRHILLDTEKVEVYTGRDNMNDPRFHDILQRMCDYLQQNVDRPMPSSLSETTRLVTDLHLDSMEGAQMLSDLEDQYEVTIAVSVLQRAETLGDVATVVVSALGTGTRK